MIRFPTMFFIFDVLPPCILLILTVRLNKILRNPIRLKATLNKHKSNKKELDMYKRIYSPLFLRASVWWTGFFFFSLLIDTYKLFDPKLSPPVLFLGLTTTLCLGGIASYLTYSALRSKLS